MSRPSIVRWVGALALAAIMTAAGCQHAKPRGMNRGRIMPMASGHVHSPYATTAAVAQPVAQPVAQAVTQPTMLPPITAPAAPVAQGAPVATVAQVASEPKEIVKSVPTPPAAPVPAMPAVETAKGNPAKDTTTVEQASSKLEAARTVSKWTSTSPKMEPAPRRSFVDITAHSCFGHGQDYGWLTGQLQHLRAKECWRLRFASVDEDDPYGGSVTRVDGNGLLANCKDGQYVRVTGRLLNASDRSIAPDYQLDSLQVVDMNMK